MNEAEVKSALDNKDIAEEIPLAQESMLGPVEDEEVYGSESERPSDENDDFFDQVMAREENEADGKIKYRSPFE